MRNWNGLFTAMASGWRRGRDGSRGHVVARSTREDMPTPACDGDCGNNGLRGRAKAWHPIGAFSGRFDRRRVSAIAAMLLCVAAVSPARDQDARSTGNEPVSRLPVALPADGARSSASIVAEGARSWIPAASIPVAARTARANVPIKEPVAGDGLPALYSAAQGAPGRPQFVQGARVLLTPSAAMTPRIPNFLGTNKRAQASGNPIILPAAPVTTPPVSNLEGTAELPHLPPFAREIQIEIAPLPGPLAFDREPYVQAANAPDDGDAPARLNEGVPGRTVLK